MNYGMIVGLVLAASAASAQDWDGFYAGVNATTGGAATRFLNTPAPFRSEDPGSLGFFAGYNYQTATNLVLGGELSYTDIDTSELISPFYGQGLLQARARVGLATGNSMPYVALGLAKTNFGISGGPASSENGYSVGVGMEFMVGTNMSIRAEFTKATFKGIGNGFMEPSPDLGLETVSIGAAFHF